MLPLCRRIAAAPVSFGGPLKPVRKLSSNLNRTRPAIQRVAPSYSSSFWSWSSPHQGTPDIAKMAPQLDSYFKKYFPALHVQRREHTTDEEQGG